MTKYTKQKGFTLLEMMITVAVIGILAVIAFPSYMHYIERGHLTQAHVGLININNEIKTQRIKEPANYKTLVQLQTLVRASHIDAEVKRKYDFQVSMPVRDSIAYNLIAKPKADSGYTKAVWMSSSGEAYRCSNAASAERFATDGDCEKIGG
ncbi:type IV pilin protein [Neisseria sp. Dent CA1/247]|uniref:type IV pilin protein n=1 Tax=Neisseria sp. Dent CA1/247 TaxID=2912675 RepID=UPI00272D19D9|nr:PilX family type IV pilin [Neisseria sp. Dent CA1/247]